METTDGLVTTTENDITTQETLLTYDEEEKLRHEIDTNMASFVFSPKFIPLYPDLLDMDLSMLDAIMLGFIDFYKSSSSARFYFTNEQISKILRCNPDSVSRSISKLQKMGLIKTSRKVKANGGTIRFVTDIFYKSELTKTTSLTRQKLQTNYNKINENKIKSSIANKNLQSPSKKNNTLLRELVGYLEEKTGTKVVNWGKQAKAVKLITQAGYTPNQIKWVIDQLSGDDFYDDKGFDLMTVVNQIPRYKQIAQKRKEALNEQTKQREKAELPLRTQASV